MARGLLLLLVLCGSYAAAGVTTPARLVEGADSIESLLKLPESLEPGRYEVPCEAQIRSRGRARSFICYYKDNAPRALVKAVTLAGRQASYVPATREGVAVDVYMLVMLRIDTTVRDPLILAVPNNGVEAARYGLLYTAPQRFNEFQWHGSELAGDSGRVLMWQKMHIDEYGKIVDYQVTNASNAPPYLVSRIENQIPRMDFMPGYTADGKPVPMFYIEPVLD